MGALALATLSRAGAGPLHGDQPAARAGRPAGRLLQAQAVRSGQLATAMAEVDLVVSATASSAPVLGLAEVVARARGPPAGAPAGHLRLGGAA